jgi:heavy metal sensor kinase
MPRWSSSLRTRLTVWYTVVLGAPLIAFAVGSYVVFARTLESRTDHFLDEALAAFSRELTAERRAGPSPLSAIQTTVNEVRFRDMRILVLDDAAHLVATGGPPEARALGEEAAERFDVDRVAAMIGQYPDTLSVLVTFEDSLGAYRLLARPILLGQSPFRLVGAYPLRDTQAMLERTRQAFLIAIPLLLASAAVGGYFLTKRRLAPLSAMAARAAEITATSLHERLPVAVPNDELGVLATVVNGLLDRLEHAFAQQRRFMADASHELRTPTAILRTEADVTLAREHREEHEYRESVGVMQDAAQRLTRIVDDLFLLARADAGHLIVRRDALYLDEIVHGATRAVRPLAERRDVRLELRPVVDAPFEGDADLLGRLLLNLLDNAIKYSPSGGSVAVALARRGGRYEITVSDDGPGIPADARERVFERFFRADAARSRVEATATSGAGLGLAIARRIAEAHRGRLGLVESRPGHTEFRVTHPAPRHAMEG